MNYLTACCIAKREQPYIEEWIDYHHAVGVERFVVYDDGDAGEEPLAELLAGRVAAGLVEVRRAPGTARKQMLAYEDCVARDGAGSAWIACFDVDEFIVPKARGDIRELLREREAPDVGGFAINWLVFGSSGHDSQPAGPVTRNYLWRSKPGFKANLHVKSIVRPGAVLAARNPHAFDYKPGLHCLNERGKAVADAWCRNSTDTIQINHYFTKSRQEFLAKAQKGRAEGGRFTKRTTGTFSSPEEMFAFYDRKCSQVQDRFILRYTAALERTTPWPSAGKNPASSSSAPAAAGPPSSPT